MSSVILGIDPGLAIVGYGIIQSDSRDTQKVIAYDAIITSSHEELSDRLIHIYESLQQLFAEYSPDLVAIESIFFGKNAKTAMSVGQARGVIYLASAQHHIPIVEFTPLQVKIALTGYGRAEKAQMQKMVQQLLKLPELPKPDDVADALAVALTGAVSYNVNEQLKIKS